MASSMDELAQVERNGKDKAVSRMKANETDTSLDGKKKERERKSTPGFSG